MAYVCLGDGKVGVVKTDGALWIYDQSGSGAIRGTHVMDDAVKVQFGQNHTAVLKTDGSVWVWGDNSSWQLGLDVSETSVPTCVLEECVDIACGPNYTVAATADGSSRMWGSGIPVSTWLWGSENPDLTADGEYQPVTRPSWWVDGMRSVCCSGSGIAYISLDNALWAGGFRTQIPEMPEVDDRDTKQALNGAVLVSCGDDHVAAVLSDGTLWTWGENQLGQLGDGTTQARYTPAQVLEDVADVACRGELCVALKTDGTLWYWGRDLQGDGSSPCPQPTQLLFQADPDASPLWQPQTDSPDPQQPEEEEGEDSSPSSSDVWSVYLAQLQDREELINAYTKWFSDPLAVQSVALADVWGDDTKELILVQATAPNSFQSSLVILTCQDGQAVTLLEESWDFLAGSGLSYTLFQGAQDKTLYATTSYSTGEGRVYINYIFEESGGALLMTETDDLPDQSLTVLCHPGSADESMHLDMAMAVLGRISAF